MLQNLAPEVTQPDPNKIDEADTTREFIARKLTRKLLRLVGTVQTKPRDASMDEELHAQF
jgi:DNA polymerase epsilon subunit 1